MTRPSLPEALEGRALLSAGPIGTVVPLPVGTVDLGAPTSEPSSATLPAEHRFAGSEDGALRKDLWRVSMSMPWRVASWRHSVGGDAFARPEDPLADHPVIVRESATFLPLRNEIRLEGMVTSGGGGHLFGIEVGRELRALRFSYEVHFPDGAESGPVRVVLGDADGNVVDSWWIDPSVRKLDVQMLSLLPARPTTFYLGIEAQEGPPGTPSAAFPFGLEVRRGPASSPPQFAVPGLPEPESPTIGSDLPNWPDLGLGLPSRPGVVPVPGFRDGAGIGLSGPSASGGLGLTIGAAEVGVPVPIGFGGGLVRPLPIQGASSAGGLLPAGPVLRVEGESTERASRLDDFDDPTLMAARTVAPDRSAGESEIEAPEAVSPDPGRWADPELLTDRESGPGPGPARWFPESSGISRLAGPGGLPMLIAGLRIARGRPAIQPSDGAPPPVPDELATMVVSQAPVTPDPAGPEIGAKEPANDDPNRERTGTRVLRTALIGATALAVGLLLPDLAHDRPKLRPTFLRWIRPGPRTR